MNPLKLQLTRSCKHAFTLIEVLVASAVMVVLVGIVAFVTGAVMNTWNRSSGKLSANAEARLALDLIAQDLETAVLRNNGQQWLRLEGPLTPAGAPYASNSVALKLFAPALDRQSGDGTCAIAYTLSYKESYTDGPDEYALYRMVVGPQDTLDDYLSSGFDDPNNSTNLQGDLADDGRTSDSDWSADTITEVDNYLAGNIVDFRILIYEIDPDTNLIDLLNANSSNQITGDYAYGGVSDAGGDEVSPNQPLYADIILTVVTDQGMDLLNNIALNLIPLDADDVVREHGETLIRRVYFKSNPI